MRKKVITTLLLGTVLYAEVVDLGDIYVESVAQEVIKDVHGEDIKSADLGEALFKQSPSISLVRRSGIANDIRVRGQKKDNINVTIDGAKVHGACPNRMDPPISHVLSNNVDFIEINEGPFNIEDTGVLSADIKIHTIKPEQKFKGVLNLSTGSFGYKKAALNLSGGAKNVRFLLSTSTESSKAYEDAEGQDFVGQIDKAINNGTTIPGVQYQIANQNKNAYKKQTMMGKVFWDIGDNQMLKLSYTANRSDEVLYPSSRMDALYDDSDIYTLNYTLKNLGKYSEKLTFDLYESSVQHPMSNKYRKMGAVDYITHDLSTKTNGIKIKNSFAVDNHAWMIGLDYSQRNWDGKYYKNDIAFPAATFHSIWDVDTKNKALFLKDILTLDKFEIDMGVRYEDTHINTSDMTQQEKRYTALNAYVFTSYNPDDKTKYFIGLGKSSRVPDAKELYWLGTKGNRIGTATLNDTVNYELDIGMKKQFEDGSLKMKLFYSKMKDYIAYNASNTVIKNGKKVPLHAYENVDATLYGLEFSGMYMLSEVVSTEYGFAYQRGKKDQALKGQTGTNLPDIAPLKANITLNYDYSDSLLLRAMLVSSKAWDTLDAENGEQKLKAYTVLNLKATQVFSKQVELTFGVDNVFDKTYTVSNTYKDLVLLPTVSTNEVMLMNEPGRYFYVNLRYNF